ncbi:MAG: hypothetical protein AB7T49_16655 [Oligoflexales bacterium]
MLSHALTTISLLLLCAILAYLQAIGIFVAHLRRRQLPAALGDVFIVPTMVLGPAALVLGFLIFKTSLIFPVFMFSNYSTILAFSVVPALILCCSSGLALNILNKTITETRHWKSKPCFLVSRAFGKSMFKAYFKPIAWKSFLSAWQQSLPWIFGELVIIESVFNVPGLGSQAWKLARERDFTNLLLVIASMFVLYLLTAKVTHLFHKKLGAKIESYA